MKKFVFLCSFFLAYGLLSNSLSVNHTTDGHYVEGNLSGALSHFKWNSSVVAFLLAHAYLPEYIISTMPDVRALRNQFVQERKAFLDANRNLDNAKALWEQERFLTYRIQKKVELWKKIKSQPGINNIIDQLSVIDRFCLKKCPEMYTELLGNLTAGCLFDLYPGKALADELSAESITTLSFNMPLSSFIESAPYSLIMSVPGLFNSVLDEFFQSEEGRKIKADFISYFKDQQKTYATSPSPSDYFVRVDNLKIKVKHEIHRLWRLAKDCSTIKTLIEKLEFRPSEQILEGFSSPARLKDETLTNLENAFKEKLQNSR